MENQPRVKVCTENRTSCRDISGESQLLELMYQNYQEKSAEKGVPITGRSGFDSIPGEMGAAHTRSKMDGTLCSVFPILTMHSGPKQLALMMEPGSQVSSLWFWRSQ